MALNRLALIALLSMENLNGKARAPQTNVLFMERNLFSFLHRNPNKKQTIRTK